MSDKEVQAGKTDTQSSKQSAQGKGARGKVKGELLTAVFQKGWGEVLGELFVVGLLFLYEVESLLAQAGLELATANIVSI